MINKREHGAEYLALKSAFRAAQRAGDTARCEQLRPRIAELDGMMWQTLIGKFPELTSYQSVVDALQQTAEQLGVGFPDLTDVRNRSGDGQFSFSVSDDMRTVQIWPRGKPSGATYSVELFDYTDDPAGVCYRGQTEVLEQVALVLSAWFVERLPIAEVHAQCPWMPCEPWQLKGPRITFE